MTGRLPLVVVCLGLAGCGGPVGPAGPLPPLRGLFKDGFRACTVDGMRWFVRSDNPESLVRAAITRNGGETVGLPR